MADEKIDYFDGIRSHFEELEVKIIEVPEWGLVGDKAIYAKPFNMQEKSKIFKGANSNDIGVLVDVIIEKALDKTISKILQMSVAEFNMWIAYFELQIEERKKQEQLHRMKK